MLKTKSFNELMSNVKSKVQNPKSKQQKSNLNRNTKLKINQKTTRNRSGGRETHGPKQTNQRRGVGLGWGKTGESTKERNERMSCKWKDTEKEILMRLLWEESV